MPGVAAEVSRRIVICLIFDEGTLYVEVADVAGDLAELLEEFANFVCGLFVLGQIGDEREELELGFDAAGGGAEAVDGVLLRVGESEGNGSFEGGGVLAQCLDGVRG